METTCFVAHQYTSKDVGEFRSGIESGLSHTGFKPLYAEREYRADAILHNVRSMILSSAFAIFDLTGANPNVFLELGIAVAARKPIYVVCRKGGGELPADVRGIQHLEYSDGDTLATELQRCISPHWQLTPDLTEEDVRRHRIRFYQAEDLYHRLGKKQKDPDASNGVCWAVPCSPIGDMERWEKTTQHAVFGPYEGLSRPGLYKAYFRIKVDDNTRPDNLVALEVYSIGNPRPADVKGERCVRGIDFCRPGVYQLFSVPFGYGYEDDLEYRIRPCARGIGLSVDFIAIISSSQERQTHHSGTRGDANGVS